MNNTFFISLLTAVICVTSCKQKVHTTHVEKAFYYWQNVPYRLDEKEVESLHKDSVQKMYVKFFEVEPNEIMGNIPVAKSQLRMEYYGFYNSDSIYRNSIENLIIVPSIYIRNAVFLHASNVELDTLADNIVFLVNKYFKEKYGSIKQPFSEIQIDCDWTPSTQEKYFYFLKQIKKCSGKTLSATLRLYPYKYPDKMGVPPVDKAMLMCYNLSGPLSREDENTILETNELEKYIKRVKKYPLHLDVALPVFSWMHVYKNNVFSGLIQYNKSDRLKDVLKEIKPNWYVVQKDFVGDDNILLKAGDKLKLEEVRPKSIHESIAMIQRYIPLSDTTTISLFHLSAQNVTHYSHEEIASFYSDFTK